MLLGVGLIKKRKEKERNKETTGNLNLQQQTARDCDDLLPSIRKSTAEKWVIFFAGLNGKHLDRYCLLFILVEILKSACLRKDDDNGMSVHEVKLADFIHSV